MDAYAGVRLETKLGIRSGHRVGLLGAPEGFEALVPSLPEGAKLQRNSQSPSDVLLVFVADRKALEDAFADALGRLAEGGRLWICWPKKPSKIASDLTQQPVRAFGLARETVDDKICSIDKTWSGFCFSRRAASRGSR